MKDPELMFNRLRRRVNEMTPRTERELKLAVIFIKREIRKIERSVK